MLIPKPVRIIFSACVAGAIVGVSLAKMKPLSIPDYLIAAAFGLVSHLAASFLTDGMDQYLRRVTRDPIYLKQNTKQNEK